MAVPTETVSTAQSQGYAPKSGSAAQMLVHPHNLAYLLHANPAVAEVVTVTEDFAKVLNIDAGDYIIPDLITVLAEPGANGVRGERDWTMERLLSTEESGGFHEIAKHLAMKGTPLLDPFKNVPRQFLPPGQVDGGYLRFDVTKFGQNVSRCHHLCFEYLEDEGLGEKAVLKLHRANWDAWRVWLVLTGAIPEVNPAAIRREKRVLQGRIAKIQGTPLDEDKAKRSLDPRKEALGRLEEAEIAVRGVVKPTEPAPKAAPKAKKGVAPTEGSGG